ncbi:Hypothetical protein NocV09_07000130 [Nannochloropsis oceanica]
MTMSLGLFPGSPNALDNHTTYVQAQGILGAENNIYHMLREDLASPPSPIEASWISLERSKEERAGAAASAAEFAALEADQISCTFKAKKRTGSMGGCSSNCRDLFQVAIYAGNTITSSSTSSGTTGKNIDDFPVSGGLNALLQYVLGLHGILHPIFRHRPWTQSPPPRPRESRPSRFFPPLSS